MATRLPLLLALAIACTGCTYFADRGRDFLDMAGFDILTGLQGGASIRATKLAQAGLAGFNGDAVSWDGRAFSTYEETRAEGGVGMIYLNNVDRIVHSKNAAYDQDDYFDEYKDENYDLVRSFDRGFFEFGIRLHAMVIGVGAMVDPVEIGDFFLGIFGVDFCRDDTRNIGRYNVPPDLGWPRRRKVPDAVEEAMEKEGMTTSSP